jgi:hypothetical protein
MTDAELAERLERLERDNRRLRRIVLAGLTLLGAMAGLGAAYATRAVPQKIVAHEFDVVDGTGRVRVKLDTQKNGFAMVQVLDTAGIVQAEMIDGPVLGPSVELGMHRETVTPPGIPRGMMTPDVSIADQPRFGPMLTLTAPGKLGGPTVGIGVTPTGQPGVTLLDSEGHDRADISLSPAGEPNIHLSDPHGNGRDRLTGNSLEFFSESGRETVRLMSAENGASLEFLGSQNQKIGKYSFPVDRMQLSTWGLYFDDKDGTSAISLGGFNSGAPSTAQRALSFFDAKGMERASIYVSPAGAPSIELSDSAGYSMDLGSTSTITPITGATQQTSAASIVMFGSGKEHHVVWQAP